MWKTPLAYYGPVHFVSIAVMLAFLALGIVLGIRDRESGKKRDKLLTTLGFVFIALEAFKIIFRIATHEDADLRLISFQICSIPMYLLPFIYFMKEGKLKQAFLGYVSFQSFTSAFFYFVKPAAVIGTKYIAISCHSVLWHSLMVASGVYAMIAYGLLTKEGFKTFLYSYVLWVITAVIAMVLDLILHAAVPGTLVDLFYISRESTFSFPLLGIFFKTHSPYVLFFITYPVYYFIGVFASYGIGLGIRTLVTRKKA